MSIHPTHFSVAKVVIGVPQLCVRVKTMSGRLEGNRSTGEYAGGGMCVEGEGRGGGDQ